MSEFQGLIDHGALIDSLHRDFGFACVIARLDYGNVKVDAYADRNIDGLRAAGADALGWYTYLIQGQDPVQQADVLVRVLQAHGGLRRNEFVVCDLEEGSGDQSGRLDAYLQEVNVGLQVPDPAGEDWWYSGLYFSIAHNLAAAQGHRWIAAYGQPEPLASHDLWQFTDAHQFQGIQGPSDASIFHGTPQDFLTLIGVPPPEPGPAPFAFNQRTDRRSKRMFVIAFNQQLHEFEVDPQGNLVHRFSPSVNGGWASENLASGMVPGALLGGDVLFGQLHILGPTQDGHVSYNWWTQGIGWKNQVLA